MPSLAELNNFIGGLNDHALAWANVITGKGPTVPPVNVQTQPSPNVPTGGSQTPSGGQPRISIAQIVTLGAVALAIGFGAFFVARKL